MPNTFVLVHGGGHGGWCWQRVARLLRADGDEVYTPTLTGFGERSHLPVNDFEVFVEDVTALIEFEDLENVVLVGHSMGCVVTPRVAERVADRLSRVVWLAGPVTLDGETVLAAMPTTPEVDLAVTVAADGSLSVDHDLLVAAMLQDGTNEDREWVRSRHRDHPKAIQVEPGRLSAFLTLGLPTAYVLARDDLLLPPTFARGFADRLGVVPIEIPGSHDCMVSRPADVAAALSQLVD